ncbi:AAA-12 domain-containing protein [Fusarium falciforme]|uniref:AAA-12 domain-containing protein n=1 Tax=Fusarium falciforme TaxID=195108 RepID=UPI0023009DE8|nr:AAA-12 domain-containing protein [Fusarium falciforme]WAO93930.1 AAA-12 domain-containing protein [Fusarium falciforme]
MYKTWILEHVGHILDSGVTGLGENSGKPIDILIIALYRAQVTEFQRAIKSLIDQGRFPKDTLNHLKVKTVDGERRRLRRNDSPQARSVCVSQDDEAVIVFVDYLTVSHPGFTADSFRGTLTLIRARGMTILLLNRGTFVGYERREQFIERSNHLFRIHDWHASRQLVQRLAGCLNCETFDHTTSECK